MTNSKNTSIPTDFQVDSETQNISELWEAIEKIAKGRVQDNERSDEYPLEMRKRQLHSLQNLIDTIQKTHNKMDNLVIGE